MRSRFALLTLSAVMLAIAGCGSSSSSSSTTSSTTAAPATTSSAPASSSSATTSSASSSAAPAAGSGGAHPLAIAADPSGQLKYTTQALTTTAGKVTITMANKSPVPHNLSIQQGTSGPVLGATPVFAGGTRTFSVTLKPGTYTYFCSVPGHRQAGMLGTLTVK